MNYLVTSFNKRSWRKHGPAWYASLKEFAGFDGKIVFITDGSLEEKHLRFLKKNDIELFEESSDYESHYLNIFSTLGKFYSRFGNCKMAYWANQAYFQSSINDIFETISEEIIFTNVQYGKAMQFSAGNDASEINFLGGSSKVFRDLARFFNFFYVIEGHATATQCMTAFTDYFLNVSKEMSPIWYCSAMFDLKQKDGKYYFNGELVRVMNPYGSRYPVFDEQHLFEYRYPEKINKYFPLIKKTLLKSTNRHSNE